MPKGPMWEGRHFAPGKKDRESLDLVAVRDFNIHTKLRKPWNRAFGPAALKDYEESLVIRGIQLNELLKVKTRNSQGGVGHVDISRWISNWSFDFMGDMVFGENFDLMGTDDKDNIIQSLDDAHWFPGISHTIPWAWSFLISIPALTKHSVAFGGFVFQHAYKRGTRTTTAKKDLFYHLAANMDIEDDKPPIPLIIPNSILAVVAGAHIISYALSSIMYHLIRYPGYLQRLQKELDEAFPPSELANLELLDAIINEVLRLQPPVMTHLQRAPPPGSGGSFIPEGTAVVVPPYVMHRDSRYFSPDPDRFWPERWYTQNNNNIKLDRSAYIPFSYGPAGCVGKSLAILELRYMTAILVYNFDLSFEDGYNPEQWNKDMVDRFITIKGSLPVKVKQRHI
ncbi:hypothetical protein Clacol_001116 [Clathrus columnatus]|uniref:Cytochrome P450 n=1 Tax=Clathrus columnatus TaxID=1419009 RepID=A0AAV5A1N6_9AGAM|nr:hypothetical protein Clacol_001116 [Clathrus columnatus]